MTDSGSTTTHPIERLASRDRAEPSPEYRFDEVYEQHFERMWRCLRGLGVPPEHLDDAVQDVFLVVHRRLSEFEGRSKLETWLFGIALRVAQGHRRRAARGRREEPLSVEQSGAGSVAPDAIVESREAWRFVERWLESLDDAKRVVFVLAELEERTAPEIAEIVGVPVNTVYSRLRAARRDFEAAVERRRAREGRMSR